ncbi:DUF2279 domain-containing protein [Chitinophaga alhagiae]|uniref:DUF2279 domain-containing protein n=1 Tax=Chitinophaga alhagiae TaxID=2203219 RepID=UPI0013004B13|nr:DUF2279 domain-containing protein [Chitinophaga alhagiae]
MPDTVMPARVWTLAAGSAAAYTGSLLVLNKYWYKDYPKRSLHTINDFGEWLQMDKFGHVYSAYLFSKYSREIWRWSGLPRKQQIWIGGLSGFAFQSVIEFLDAHSAQWGWSWGDMGANALGAGIMIGQELAWNEQRFQLKFSSTPVHYRDPVLRARAIDQFGTRLVERTLKDYNSQTYWLSMNISSLLQEKNMPRWLNVAVGYGVEGLYGARGNNWEDGEDVLYSYSHIRRTRRVFLSPDVDFTKIPTRHKGVKILFQVLNMIKVPAPALEVNGAGQLKLHALKF